MKSKIKRVLSVFLVMLMIAGMVPTFALAAGPKTLGDYVTISNKPTAIDNAYIEKDYPADIIIDGEVVASGSFKGAVALNNAYEVTINSSLSGIYQFSSKKAVSITGISLGYGNWISDDSMRIKGTFDTADKNARLQIVLTDVHGDNHDFSRYVHDKATAGAESTHHLECLYCDEVKADSTSSCEFEELGRDYDKHEITYGCKQCGYQYKAEMPKYTLTYDANGGSDAPAAVTGYESVSYTLSTDAPKHAAVDGKAVAFGGWSTEDSNEKVYDRNAPTVPPIVFSVPLKSNVTVYAVWGIDSDKNGVPDYSEASRLYYDGNGAKSAADVPVDTQMYLPGEEAALAGADKIAHDDVDGKKVIFGGWSPVKTDVLGKDDTLPELISKVKFAESDITVYAVWGIDENGDGRIDAAQSKYDLTYNNNGGTGAPAAVKDIIEGTKVTLSDVKPTHAAASDGTPILFAGWTETAVTEILEKGDMLNALTEVTMDADKDVYAAYSLDKDNDGTPDVLQGEVTLSFDANGGEKAPAAITATMSGSAAKITVPKEIPSRSEYSFKGWAETKDGAVKYAPGTELSISEDKVLYAVWELNPLVKYTLSFNPYGGENAPKPITVETRLGYADITIPKEIPSRGELLFIGWNHDGHGFAEYQPKETIRIYGDTTLYALWIEKPTTPKTGDDSNIALWAALLTLSAIGAGAALHFGKKRSRG